MTCIAIIRNKRGKLVFAGDRRMTMGTKYYVSPTPKVVKINGILLGGAGDASFAHNMMPIPDIQQIDKDIYTYMYEVYAPALFEYYRYHKIIHPEQNRLNIDLNDSLIDKDDGASVIVIGIHGRLFEFNLDRFSIGFYEIEVPTAIGCGGDLALGSLEATRTMKMTTKARLTLALNIAAKFDSACDTNIDIISED